VIACFSGLWKKVFLAVRQLILHTKYIEFQSSQYIADLIYKSFEYGMEHYCKSLLDDIFSNLHLTNNLMDKHEMKEVYVYNVYVKTLILTLEKFVGTAYESEVREKILNKYVLSDMLVYMEQLSKVTPVLIKNYMTLQLVFDCFTLWQCADVKCLLNVISSRFKEFKNLQSYKQINNLYTQVIKYANVSNTEVKKNTVFEKELIVGQVSVCMLLCSLNMPICIEIVFRVISPYS